MKWLAQEYGSGIRHISIAECGLRIAECHAAEIDRVADSMIAGFFWLSGNGFPDHQFFLVIM